MVPLFDETVLHRMLEEHKKQVQIDSRLAMPYRKRLRLSTTMAFLSGLGLGISHGSSAAGLQYRAENAHRLPTTTTGWYLYHKTKNYQMAWGGLKDGIKMGTKLSLWTAAFFVIEDCIDHCRGSKDFVNTVMASVSVAGAFSLWNQFPMMTAARTVRLGLATGLAYGIAQDALGYSRGRIPGYIEPILRRGKSADDGSVSRTQKGMA